MKYFLIIALLMGFCIDYAIDPNEQDNPLRIYYTASSRGYYYEIALQEPVIKVFHSRDRSPAAEGTLTEETWNEIRSLLAEIKLKDLEKLNPPLEKSSTDRAAVAQLRVCHEGKSYKSTNFDHGSPPKMLKHLVGKMESLAVSVESEE